MADIQYLNYGDLQIELLALLNNLANNVQSYVQNLPWSNKRKEKFMSAYSDLMNRGLLGASNSTGQWMVDVGGDKIDLNSMSKKDREMYQEAAYFIQQQMAGLPTKASEEEQKEKEKSELPIFDNKYFTENFGNHISNQMFGGRPIDTQTDWNSLDERGENGLRGTNKRAEALANMLESYSNSLEEGKHNFEGSPFKDLNDFKSRITNAVSKLRDGTWNLDDKDALNLIGLNSSDWFNNGSGDTTKIRLEDGTERELTYAELADYNNLIEQNKLKLLDAEELARRDEVKKKHNEKIDFFRRYGVRNTTQKLNNLHSLTQLADKYGSAENLANKLREYSERGLKLNPDEMDEMLSAFHHGANSPISDNEYYLLLNYTKFKGGSRNRFKKFKGVDDLIYDSSTGRVILLYDKAVDGAGVDFLAGYSSKNKELEYLNSKIPGITNAEWKELSAIGLDIASIVNPEAITGSAMALGAAGLRHSAKNDSNPNWSFGDYFWQGVDYLTGALGGIQVAGDLVLGAKTMATASKAVPILRKVARLGAWTDLYLSYPDLKEATRKITSGEELTVKDWRAIGQGIRGLVSHGRLNRGNRAERRVLEKSGLNVTPENISSMRGKALNYSLKLGFTRTKPTNTSEVSTVKATVNGKESEIEISQNAKARILEKVNKAGNSTEARNKAVKEVLESEGKVKASDKVEVEAPSSIRDGRFRPNWIGTSKNIFGTKQVNSLLGNDVFNEYISGNRSYWDRYKYGSNTELKGIYNRLNRNNSVKPTELLTETPSETPKTTETPKINRKRMSELQEKFGRNKTEQSNPKLEYNLKQQHRAEKEIDLFLKSYGEENNPSRSSFVGGYGSSKNKIKPGEHFFDLGNGQKIKFSITKEEISKLPPIGEIRNKIQKQIKELVINKTDNITTGNILRKLKKQGVLKQGGIIDKQKIQRYKEFITK